MTVAGAAARYRFQGPEDRKRAYRSAIEADTDQKIFNGQFIDGLGRRLDDLSATINGVDKIGYSVLAYLAVSVLSVHVPITAFGFSLEDSKNARELLLIVWSSLRYYRQLINRDRTYCQELLECLLERRAGNDVIALNALMFRYGIEAANYKLVQKDARPGATTNFLLGGYTFLILGWTALHRVLLYAVLVVTIVSILREPSVAEWFSVLVVFYVISLFLVGFGVLTVSGVVKTKSKPPINLPDL